MTTLAKRLIRLSARLGFERDWYLVIVAMGIGLVMGGVATAFIYPLRMIEEWTAGADRRILWWLVPIAPAVGGLLAGIVIKLFALEVRGPGVSAVMFAIARRKSQLPLRLGLRKWIASTLTIGSGGSAGAEGPIVTIGSVIGSTIARGLGTNPQNRATLLGCGAAAGISAVFNAPIAGIFFVMEILLRDFSLRTFTPIVIASVVSAAWAQPILGGDPIFAIPTEIFGGGERFSVTQIPNFLLLGLLCGVAAATFIRGLSISEACFMRVRIPTVLKPMLGGLMLGALGLLSLFLFHPDHTNAPAFFGNGYTEIEHWLDPDSYDMVDTIGAAAPLFLLLCAIAVLKALATCLTIGSGGAGGMFAPSLLMGATVGGAFGYMVDTLGWAPSAGPALYALVGMGAMVAATTHAPLTGILIVYEITLQYETIMPLMLAAVISTIVGRLVFPESVYTAKLTRLGVRVGAMSDLTILRRLSVNDVRLSEAITVHRDESAQRLLELSEKQHVSDFVVVDDSGNYCGMVTGADLQAALVYREAIPLLQVSELVRSDLPTVTPDEPLDVVLDKFSRHDVQSLSVLEDDGQGAVLGLITRSRLMHRYQRALNEK
ncbi:MAG: chloride channel protein [Planctomycetota bacterium]|jgi:CIC family chloride channel protein